jgi:hypothetical protein
VFTVVLCHPFHVPIVSNFVAGVDHPDQSLRQLKRFSLQKVFIYCSLHMATLLEICSLLLPIVQTKNFKFAWHDVISDFLVGVDVCLLYNFDLFVLCIF